MNESVNKQFLKAQHYSDIGRFKLCIKELEDVLNLEPDHFPAKRLMLLCKLNTETDNRDLEKWAKIVLSQEPNESLAHFAMGQIYSEKSQYQKAKNHFEIALNEFPEHVDYILALAQLHWHLNDYKKCKSLADQAIELEPNNAKALTYKSILENYHFNHSKAQENIERALESNPLNAFAHYHSGKIALGNMNPRKAESHFKTSLSLDPHDDETRVAYLNSILVRYFPFRLLYSKYYFFNSIPDPLRPLFVFIFLMIIIAFSSEENTNWAMFGYLFAIIGFSLNGFIWIIAPLIRWGLSKKIWKSNTMSLFSYRNYILASIQLALLAGFYFFISNDFRGITTGMFLSAYAIISIVISGSEDKLKSKIFTIFLVFVYCCATLNLFLNIMGIKYLPLTMIPASGWILIILINDPLDWLLDKFRR